MNKFNKYTDSWEKAYLLYLVYFILITPLGLVYLITNLIAPVSPMSFAELDQYRR